MMPVASVGVCTLEEAVTSSTPYGLTLLWETLHLQIGHTRKRCDPGSSGPPRYGSPSRAPGSERCDIVSAQLPGVCSTDNYAFLGKQQRVRSGFRSCWSPRWCPQAEWLGVMTGDDGG